METAGTAMWSATLGPDQIHWHEEGAVCVPGASCPVCGHSGTHPAVLDVLSMAPPFPRLSFLRCPSCGSGHYDPPGVTDFADLGQKRDDFWRFYVEVGGGVWETLWPILADRSPRTTLLDVGCGFGFAVDAWSRLGLGPAIGVELADYGQVGARMLGITVHDQLLDDCPALAGRQFDVVYASEVIEHVPDPRAFVASLARYLAPDGLLVLTTPAMDFIRRSETSPTLHAALAPGFHGFLLSADRFAQSARDCGFTHVDVRVMNERQILWASRAPMELDPASPAAFARYLAYLESRVRTGDPASSVWQGLAYRLVKEWSNAGDTARARELAQRLLVAVEEGFGPAAVDPSLLLERLRPCTTLEHVGREMPYFMPNLFFHLGNLELMETGDQLAARRMYEGCIACTLELSRLGSVFFLEAISLVWPARIALADIDFAQGRIEEGAAGYARVAAHGDLGAAEDGFSRAPLPLIEARVPRRAEELRRRGLRAAAATILAGYRVHVRQRYGEAFLTAGGVDEGIAQGAPLPRDPLFAPWLEAMLALAGAPTARSAEVEAQAREVLRIAQRRAGHPVHGARMRDYAAALGVALAPSTRVVFSMSTSFKL